MVWVGVVHLLYLRSHMYAPICFPTMEAMSKPMVSSPTSTASSKPKD